MRRNVDFSKTQRRKLRELKQKAYQIELDRELEHLYQQFCRWKMGELITWDLADAIHDFHRGPSRKLYGRYNDTDDDIIVAWALKQGILSRDEIPDELYQAIESILSFYEYRED